MADSRRITRSMITSLKDDSDIQTATKGRKRKLSDVNQHTAKRIKGLSRSTKRQQVEPKNSRSKVKIPRGAKANTSLIKKRPQQEQPKKAFKPNVKVPSGANANISLTRKRPQQNEPKKATKSKAKIPRCAKSNISSKSKVRTESETNYKISLHLKGKPIQDGILFQLERKERFKLINKANAKNRTSSVWSMCIMDSGDLLVTDTGYPYLKRVDGDTHKIKDTLQLPAHSNSICMVNEKEAVVALDNHSIQFVSVQNKLLTTRQIMLEHYCLGICVIAENLYITDGENHNLFIYDLEGNLQRKVGGEDIFSWNRFMTGTDDNSAFYVTDLDKMVFKMGRNGEVIWNLGEVPLRAPFGICTDGHGNVIVAGNESENVVLISPEGKFLKEIVTSKECIPNITGVCFDREKSKLYVSKYYCDYITVYYFK